ncbi:hypothetical protein [Aeromonas phage 3]|nr:hypothetical protein [Aeromonas phage 3]
MSDKPEAPLSRKAAQRERDKASGYKRVELRLPPELAEKIERACTIRGGTLGPYEFQEYLITLLEQDAEKLELQMEQLLDAPCKKCGSPLPGGCGGVHKWDINCLQTREEKQLLLREPFPFKEVR